MLVCVGPVWGRVSDPAATRRVAAYLARPQSKTNLRR